MILYNVLKLFYERFFKKGYYNKILKYYKMLSSKGFDDYYFLMFYILIVVCMLLCLNGGICILLNICFCDEIYIG